MLRCLQAMLGTSAWSQQHCSHARPLTMLSTLYLQHGQVANCCCEAGWPCRAAAHRPAAATNLMVDRHHGQAVVPNWAAEFGKWAPHMPVLQYDGDAEARKALRVQYLATGSFQVMVTHYDLIVRDRTFLKKVAAHMQRAPRAVLWSLACLEIGLKL